MDKTSIGPLWMTQTKEGTCPAVGKVKLMMMIPDITRFVSMENRIIGIKCATEIMKTIRIILVKMLMYILLF